MKKILLTIFMLSGLLFFAGCGGDEKKSPSIQLTIDGEEVKAKLLVAQMITGVVAGEDSRTLTISATIGAGSDVFMISISGYDMFGHPEGGWLEKEYSTDITNVVEQCQYSEETELTYCDTGLITYTEGTTFYSSAFLEGYDGHIEVTSSDGKAEKISGTFHTKITNNPEDPGIIVEGKFNDIPYLLP